jgi:hypothetical protein
MNALQTPPNVRTRSNLTSFVLDCRRCTRDFRLYQAVQEYQWNTGSKSAGTAGPSCFSTAENIHELRNSGREYDISAVSGASNVKLLGQEGWEKMRFFDFFPVLISTDMMKFPFACPRATA